MSESAQVPPCKPRILLVDETRTLRDSRASTLSTHGYDVETVSTMAEAHGRWRDSRAHLVLVAIGDNPRAAFRLWKSISDSGEEQLVSGLMAPGQRLCPVFYNGRLILQGEEPEDFLHQVSGLLPR